MAKSDLTADRVRELLHYDSETGALTWRNCKKRTPDGLAGCFRSDGYRMIRVDDVLHYAHRLVWLYVTGQFPADHIDHINGDRSNNRFENLRDVPNAINSQNQRKASSCNKASGLLGVQRNHNGWQACITTNGKRKCLGTYKTPEEAHAAYLAAKRERHIGCTI